MSDDTLGRRILLVLGAVIVVLSGLVGFVVGANGAETTPEVSVLGAVTIPVAPLPMAAYGIVLATVVLVGLFVAVTLASRYDGET